MDLDTAKIDDAVLGLLALTLFDDGRAWKSFDWDAMARLHAKGYILDPVNKAKSVVLTDTGRDEANRLLAALFGKPASAVSHVEYGGAPATARPAGGATGVLCRSAVDGRTIFRVYDADSAFTDFDLRHDELSVTIAPGAMACFYAQGDQRVLDHSPAVLGLRAIGERATE
jgi:hypothetical protein